MFPRRELGEFLELTTYGFTNPMPDADEGPWKVTAKDVINGSINYQTARRTTRSAFENDLTDKSRPKIGDVLLTKDGTLGRLAVVREEGFCVNQSVAVLRPNKNMSSDYLYYLLSSPKCQHQLVADSDGSVLKHIYITRVPKMEVEVPSLDVQRVIVKVLKSIDDKIELNRQINATLQSMAQALFKSWFVEFDPVIDNALQAGNPIPEPLQARAEKRKALGDQRKPIPEHVQSQFPSSFVFSEEAGWVPEGWALQRLDRVIELAYGKALKKSDREDGSTPVYGSGGIIGFHSEALVQGPGIIVGRKGTVGSLYWESRDCFPIDTVFYVKPLEGYSLEYCYQLLGTLGLDTMNTDAAVPGLNRNNAYRLVTVRPPALLHDEYTRFSRNVQNRCDCNDRESNSLENIRDLILPKLLSGQLRIPAIEKQLAEAI